jgi:hypothetical protein
MKSCRLIPCSSLVKVFPDETPEDDYRGGSMLRGERYSFQIAYSSNLPMQESHRVRVEVDSPLRAAVRLYQVGLVISTLPSYPHWDENTLRTRPGIFPDPLTALPDGNLLRCKRGCWQSLWVMIDGAHTDLPAGTFPVTVRFLPEETGEPQEVTVPVRVLSAELPQQETIYTNWFHCDCIADVHHCAVFSEEHWELIDAYMKLAAENGMNMILTPCFTPPLDTEVGHERKTVQLVEVSRNGDRYEFGFDRLLRWMKLVQKHGIRYLEHSHLFTQWGAKHAPKIMGTENGEYRRLFGWETDAVGPEYANFLHQYLPAFLQFAEAHGFRDMVYFHISDEPELSQLKDYSAARRVVRDDIRSYKTFDALSDYAFYETGEVPTPVCATHKVEDFLGKADGLWVYYTGGQSSGGLSNRLISMSSQSCRIIGTQMFKYNIRGFLQWAFNYYYTRLSREICDPMQSTDAFGEWPSGNRVHGLPDRRRPDSVAAPVRVRGRAAGYARHAAAGTVRRA